MTGLATDRCHRVPRAKPAACASGAIVVDEDMNWFSNCPSTRDVCSSRQARSPSHYETLERFPAVYARELTDAQVEELFSISEYGGSRFPDGSQKEVYARLEGRAGRRPAGTSSRDHFAHRQVRPRLIEFRGGFHSGRWVLTPLGRAVLACFYSPIVLTLDERGVVAYVKKNGTPKIQMESYSCQFCAAPSVAGHDWKGEPCCARCWTEAAVG